MQPTLCGRTTIKHQYQTGSLEGEFLAPSLSKAKTDSVGQPQCKSGASHPQNLFFHFLSCYRFLCHSRLKLSSIIEAHFIPENVWELSSNNDCNSISKSNKLKVIHQSARIGRKSGSLKIILVQILTK